MKKQLLILLSFPFIGVGQDVRGFSKCDVVINQFLENTADFIKDIKKPKTTFRFYLKNQRSSINWNQEKFSKWQIVYKKENHKIE